MFKKISQNFVKPPLKILPYLADFSPQLMVMYVLYECACASGFHYENTPIQIYRKFHLQNL